jgi:hypothetical protein
MIDVSYFSKKAERKRANGPNADGPITYRGIVYPWHFDRVAVT